MRVSSESENDTSLLLENSFLSDRDSSNNLLLTVIHYHSESCRRAGTHFWLLENIFFGKNVKTYSLQH